MKTLILISLLILVGCDNNDKKSKVPIEPTTTAKIIYQGEVEGCMETYDPIWCADKYKPENRNTLNSEPQETVKDEDGEVIILNKVVK